MYVLNRHEIKQLHVFHGAVALRYKTFLILPLDLFIWYDENLKSKELPSLTVSSHLLRLSLLIGENSV